LRRGNANPGEAADTEIVCKEKLLDAFREKNRSDNQADLELLIVALS